MATNVRVELRSYQGNTRFDREKVMLSLIRQFKRAVNEAGVLHTLKEKEFYEKPGDKRRRKQRHAELQRKYAAMIPEELRRRGFEE